MTLHRVLVDAQGRVLAQSPTISLAPGAFRSVGFARQRANQGFY
jgi:hypothetical protein